jgi:hypothetical protein
MIHAHIYEIGIPLLTGLVGYALHLNRAARKAYNKRLR